MNSKCYKVRGTQENGILNVVYFYVILPSFISDIFLSLYWMIFISIPLYSGLSHLIKSKQLNIYVPLSPHSLLLTVPPSVPPSSPHIFCCPSRLSLLFHSLFIAQLWPGFQYQLPHYWSCFSSICSQIQFLPYLVYQAAVIKKPWTNHLIFETNFSFINEGEKTLLNNLQIWVQI